MKNKLNFFVCILAVINGVYPLLSLISNLFGYSVLLAFPTVYSLLLAVIFIYSNYFIKEIEETENSKTAVIPAAFLPVITAVNLAVFVFKNKSTLTALIMGICLIFAVVIAEKVLKSKETKVLSVISSGFICLFAFVFSFITVFSAKFVVKSVEMVVNSPNRTYYAEVVNVDQGALGGETVVYVYRNKTVNLFFLYFTKKPQRVYMGDWGEYKTMQIEWKDEKIIAVDGKEYSINI